MSGVRGPAAATAGENPPAGKEFLARAARLVRRARLRAMAGGAVQGAFWGLAGAAAVLLCGDLVRLPAPPAALGAAAAAAGILAGLVSGLARRIDTRRLLVGADRALASAELTSTAFDLIVTGKPTRFAGAIVESASRLLAAGPGRLLPPPRMRLLPYLPLLAAAAVALALFPVDLASLLFPKPPPAAGLSLLAQELEDMGRRLEKRAARTGEDRMLALSQELLQIGRDFQQEKILTGDAMDRLSDLEKRLEEYGLSIQRAPARGERAALPDAAAAPPESAVPGEGEAAPPDSPGAAGKDRTPGGGSGAGKGRNGREKTGEPKEGAGGGTGSGGSSGRGSGPQNGQPEGGGKQGGGGGETRGSSGAGTEPDATKRGPPSRIDLSGRGPAARIESPQGDGDAARLLLRALPGFSASRIPEVELRRQYRRAAEAAIAREEIPPALRDSVKGYFLSIGILQGKQGEHD